MSQWELPHKMGLDLGKGAFLLLQPSPKIVCLLDVLSEPGVSPFSRGIWVVQPSTHLSPVTFVRTGDNHEVPT